ncbi:hypothetical protein OPV22_013005 [Ensete ventricosum]|uniref:Starch synthase, chloroplastic/amyloplastic n=1 Tax=Ensete ventricosum TaxID=4639 RepID=A0AAV8PM75_ENSVE|nr:hypothetical protein OPV22_013005 [Ensete ventricosum]
MMSFGSQTFRLEACSGGGKNPVLLQNKSDDSRRASVVAAVVSGNAIFPGGGGCRVRFATRCRRSEILVAMEKGRGLSSTSGVIIGRCNSSTVSNSSLVQSSESMMSQTQHIGNTENSLEEAEGQGDILQAHGLAKDADLYSTSDSVESSLLMQESERSTEDENAQNHMEAKSDGVDTVAHNEVPWHVSCNGSCYGDGNLVFVTNDWHTSLLPVYLKAYYRDNGLMKYVRSILVIHNISHQGRGPVEDFFHVDLPDQHMDLFKLYEPMGGDHFNIFAAGLKTADRVITIQGIVNGIDTEDWNPELDLHLQSDGYTNYSIETLQAEKPQCKAALQKELGLPVREDVPLIGFIGRLDHQKGVDLIAEAMPWIVGQDAQLVMLGTGRADLEDMLRKFDMEHHDMVRGRVGFSVKMAHKITAGADILLMPSRFEPCGLNQLYAMKYGTVPVVHVVGGLPDKVIPFDPFTESGFGWTFDRAEANKLVNALGNCLNTYRSHKESWKGVQTRGMAQDLSWDNAAKHYEDVLVAANFQW